MKIQYREDEARALEILRLCGGSQYKKYITADKPDLQNTERSAGVEVVTACFSDEKETGNAIHKNALEDKHCYPKEKVENILTEKGFIPLYEDGVIIGETHTLRFPESSDLLLQQIIKKSQKLPTYENFTIFELFIFDETDCLDRQMFHKRNLRFLEEYKNILHDNIKKYFQRIFIFRYGFKLIDILDVDEGKLQPYEIPNNTLSTIYSRNQ